MELIKNKVEYEKIYPHDLKYIKKKDYPTRYPCFCEVVYEEGGLGGGYHWVRKIYPPKGVDLKSFQKGLEARKE